MTKQEERYAAYQARRKKRIANEKKKESNVESYCHDRYMKLIKTGFRTNLNR